MKQKQNIEIECSHEKVKIKIEVTSQKVDEVVV